MEREGGPPNSKRLHASVEIWIRGKWNAWGPAAEGDTDARRVRCALEIQGDERQGFVLAYSPDGVFGADDWFATLEQALTAAERSLGVGRDAWSSEAGTDRANAHVDDGRPAARRLLGELAAALVSCGEYAAARRVRERRAAPDDVLAEYLVSDELWGGAGSLADQGGFARDGGGDDEGPDDRARRRRVEAALVALGEHQLEAGLVNPRTASWVAAFRAGRDAGR